VWPGRAMAVTFNDNGQRCFSVAATHSDGGDPVSYDEWIARSWNLTRAGAASAGRPLFEEASSVND